MQSIIDLYDKKEIAELYNEQSLLNQLLQNPDIQKKKILIKNKKIMISEEKKNKVYFILDGMIQANDKEKILYFRGKNHFIGLETMLFNGKTPLTMYSLGDGEVMEFEKLEIIQYIMSQQEGWFYLYMINQDLIELLMRNYKAFLLRPYQRCKLVLLDLAHEYDDKKQDYLVLPKQFTFLHLAEYLGISVVTIRRIFEKLMDEQFIIKTVNEKHICIQAPASQIQNE
ncbi:hypothetical protein BMT55_12820 [Listeria newyorkensis]|uniref:Crp/Fnr family transcriptional regulator n=1 Tax=Listeria newyorkensis TaxID=1497681 RepID=A0ABX4XJC3_9LIST|nr:Crp/Fnr family transcriptional regulator [Listeria newyorkensis]KGL45583.1 hypothetical protein EP58_03710 [Listeria newyorkensis]PNP89375.1 hypothetical protein BMT55_12820 [Listeria newyorkensis]WAO22947.1 Crp/Fnr family transcriptional regulator [Listeria newyorkensis]SQC57236.1 Uncharacterised protein [Listeria newyorkensis]